MPNYVKIELNGLNAFVTKKETFYVRFEKEGKFTPEIRLGDVERSELPRGSISNAINSLENIGVEVNKERTKKLLFKVKAAINSDEELRRKLEEIGRKGKQENGKRRIEEKNGKEERNKLRNIRVKDKNGELIEISLENRVLVPLVSHVKDVKVLPYFKLKVLCDVLRTHGCDLSEKFGKRNCELFCSCSSSDSAKHVSNEVNKREQNNTQCKKEEKAGEQRTACDCNVCAAPVMFMQLKISENPDILDTLDQADLFLIQKEALEEIPVLTLDMDTFFDVHYVFLDLEGNVIPLPKEIAERKIEELKEKGWTLFDKIPEPSIKKVKRFIRSVFELITFQDTREIYFYDGGVYRGGGEDLITTFCILFGFSSMKTRILSEIKDETLIERKKVENKWLICLENGVLDLRTFEIKPHSPKCLLFNKIPVKYDPKADCPRIKQFLREVLHEEDIPIIEELFGYCLLKDYPIQKAFMFIGDGANGKSTLLGLFLAFLGPENCSSISLQALVEDKFASAELYGKLANIYADLPDEALRNTGIFKMVTGGDIITAQRKFQHPFQFINYAKLIFSANKLPEVRDETDAFFRRWIIVNFPNKFEGDKADKNLLKKLTTPQELSGLLNLALNGLKRLLERGEFSHGKSTDEVREQYTKMSDSVAAFCADMIEESPESYEFKKVLYAAYCEYCRQNKLPAVSYNTFHKKLPRYVRVEDYRPRVGDKRQTAWKGIKLKRNKLGKKDEDIAFSVSSALGIERETIERILEPKYADFVDVEHATGIDALTDEFSGPLHPETFKRFDIQLDGCITYYTCKRCGFRVTSEYDAYWHWKACLEHPEWMEEYRQREAERKALLSLFLDLTEVSRYAPGFRSSE
ncbi:hypothetical protein DRP04_04855 [Archaeoglobales archaeon]|nr:MAG: hypothetical protein DRP04_04855 [Archaeoglobales archaeon]